MLRDALRSFFARLDLQDLPIFILLFFCAGTYQMGYREQNLLLMLLAMLNSSLFWLLAAMTPFFGKTVNHRDHWGYFLNTVAALSAAVGTMAGLNHPWEAVGLIDPAPPPVAHGNQAPR